MRPLAKNFQSESFNFSHLGRHLAKARADRGLTQKILAESCGLTQSEISKIEAGVRQPTPPQLARLAQELRLPLQWFLSGRNYPGFELRDIAIELHHLGVVDLFVPDSNVPGAFRPAEHIVAKIVSGDQPDPRLVEALPAVFAWNLWHPHLLTAYAHALDRRAASRLAWLAEIALLIHKSHTFPGGFYDPEGLSRFVTRTFEARAKQTSRPDDLGRPALTDEELPPISRRWNITYAADLAAFHRRANHLLTLRAEELERRPSRGGSHA